MGRELKRVALDFDWPLDKAWDGFLRHSERCPECEGRGATTDARWLECVVHLLMMLGDTVRPDRDVHPWLRDLPFPGTRRGEIVPPGAELRRLTTALAGREPSFMGHDAIDNWSAQKAILKAAGMPKKWGQCPACKGHGETPESRKRTRRWKPKEPPKGEGWQLWETVSEGSPISPVFATPEGLIDFMSQPSEKRWAQGYSRAAAEAFVRGDGWAPSMVSSPETGLVDGVSALAVSP